MSAPKPPIPTEFFADMFDDLIAIASECAHTSLAHAEFSVVESGVAIYAEMTCAECGVKIGGLLKNAASSNESGVAH